jgi:hypothetical protein
MLFDDTVALGGLVVIVLAIAFKVRDFKPAWPSHVVEFYGMEGSRDISVSIVCEYRLDDRGLIPGRGRGFFPLACVSTLVLEALAASYPMSTGGPFQEVKRGRGVTPITYLHLVPSSRMSRSYTLSCACMAVPGRL